jgi:hypothetical protein
MNRILLFIFIVIICVVLIVVYRTYLQNGVIKGSGGGDYPSTSRNMNEIAREAFLEQKDSRDSLIHNIGFNVDSGVHDMVIGDGKNRYELDKIFQSPMIRHKYSNNYNSTNKFELPTQMETAKAVVKNRFSYPRTELPELKHKYTKYTSNTSNAYNNDKYKYNLSWMKYKTWAELRQSKKHYTAYNDCRRAVLQNKHLDWSKINNIIVPKLNENFEYIGTIDIQPDGKTLYISSLKRSPIVKGKTDSELVYASIPNDLVATMSDRPALFLFHTHPDDVHCDPMPSSEDISTSIFFAAINRYAANVIVSAYGIILYSASGYIINLINSFKNDAEWESAVLNFSHDVVAAHETIRSWSTYTLRDYIDFYSRYNLFIYIYPSSRYVAERGSTRPNLHKQIDHHIIHRHHEDIIKHDNKSS